jgi:type I restriction enzyme S subunit
VKTTRLKDIVSINRRTLGENTPEDLSFRYLDIGSVTGGRVAIPADQITFGAAPSRARRLAEPGDTIVSTVRTYLRAVAAVPRSEGLLVFSTGFAVLHPSDVVCARWLTYYCQTDRFVEEVVARSVGVSYPAINATELGDFRLGLPQLDEQRRIADFLDTEIERIEGTSRRFQDVQAKLHERRLAQIFDLVAGASRREKRPSRLAWVKDLPLHWGEVKLAYVARLGSGHTPSRLHPEWWIDCHIPWITTGEVQQVRNDRREVLQGTRECISLLGLANSAAELRPPGTVVLCRTAASAGYSAVMDREMTTSQDFATWTCGPKLDPFYLLWCLRAMRRDLLERLAMGSTHKTIYMPDLQSIRIPLPPVSEQREIVAAIRQRNGTLDSLLDRIARQDELLAARRQALITAAVTGQLDVATARGAA